MLGEVQLFAQGNDCVQVAYFDVGKYCCNPAQDFGESRNFVLPFV
jgi:hypothetical protein